MKNLLRRMSMHSKLKRSALLLSMGLFLISLSQNCYCTKLDSCNYGLGALLWGWLGLYFGWIGIVWLANPLMFIAWRKFEHKPMVSLVFSIMAVICATGFLFVKEIYNIDWGIDGLVTNYKSGYWLWMASCCIMLFTNLVVYAQAKSINIAWLTAPASAMIIIGLILGLSREKEITFYSSGYEIDYTFRGNLDTNAATYKIANLKPILLMCKSYMHKNDTITANNIITSYHRYGKPLGAAQLADRRYPAIDTIIKYRYRIFDTTAVLKHH